MDKLTRSLNEVSAHIHRFQKRVESLLNMEIMDAESPPRAGSGIPPFEASRDPALLRDLPLALPDDHIDRAIVLFSRMAGLFDAGLLLENHDGVWRPQAVFRNGIPRPWRKDPPSSIGLPALSPLSVLRTPARGFLARLDASDLVNTDRATDLFLIKPVPDFAYALLSTLPDLWLKSHMERTVKALNEGFSL